MPTRHARIPLALAALCLSAAALAQDVSSVMKVQRPKGGEYLGLYLMGQKAGWVFQDVDFVEGRRDQVRARSETYFRATIGGKVAERTVRETRIYEARPNGRLLSFRFELKGDGGEQTFEGTATPAGVTVVRKRPDRPNQVLQLPPVREQVEDADQVRLAIASGKKVEGSIIDGEDLSPYSVTTTPGGEEERLVAGVKLKLRKATTYSEKEKVSVDNYLGEHGETVEVSFAGTMDARAEPEEQAKRLDKVEVFGLTRVVLPSPLPQSAFRVPGIVKLVTTGIPPKFRVDTYRQRFRALPGDKVEITIQAPAVADKAKRLPLRDPGGGVYLRSTLSVESDSKEVVDLERKVVGGDKSAFSAARKIVDWVFHNVHSDYGASSDRATDVIRSMKGDCTEHALLAVALMRAAGIPAKRVDGLVYMVANDGIPALYWHEWVEAYVGEWVQMDPTFGEEIASAGHLAVGEEQNAEIVPLLGQIKVLEVH